MVSSSVRLAAVLLLCACTTQPAGPPPPPNVLLVSIGGVRSDHLGAYGYEGETSAVIDRVAAGGALFASAVAATPASLPSRATLLTALPPEGHGVTRPDGPRLGAVPTLAGAFRDAGYTTAAFTSSDDALGAGLDEGFQTVDAPEPSALTSRAIAWLAARSEAAPRAPFFLFVAMDSPHRATATADPEQWATAYDDAIHAADESLGRLLDELDRLGLADDTIVAVTTDHGVTLPNERRQNGHRLYDEVVRIPWVVRYPRTVTAGRRIDRQVRLMDVAPTLLGLARIVPPTGFGSGSTNPYRAHDVSPWLAGARPASAFPDLAAFIHGGSGQASDAVRTRRQKLIVTETGEGALVEFYDLAQDPGETNDLGRAEPRRSRALQGALRAWREHWAPGAPRPLESPVIPSS